MAVGTIIMGVGSIVLWRSEFWGRAYERTFGSPLTERRLRITTVYLAIWTAVLALAIFLTDGEL
jgi:hypothetical protein